jgi:hypothetical protein
MAEQSSDSDEDWDNLGDWGGLTPVMEGVIAPALRETAISPTASWDEDDEPWPAANAVPPGRGTGAPRPASSVSWDNTVAGGEDEGPPAEGVVSPRVADGRRIDEMFAWAPDETWKSGEPSTRGLGRPRTEVERLDELRRAAGDLVLPGDWASDAQGWVVQERREEPPPAEGVVAEDDVLEVQQVIPEAEGVLGEGPRADGAFAETFAWEGELEEEWGPEERLNLPGRGAGAPVPPTVRRDQGRLPMTAYELELLQAMVRKLISLKKIISMEQIYVFLNCMPPVYINCMDLSL